MKNFDLSIYRHSLAHILAAAVQELYPQVKFAIGPAVDDGFYYDFDFGQTKIVPEDLLKIEEKMRQLIKENMTFQNEEIAISKAGQKISKEQIYKRELLEDLKKQQTKTVTFYQIGNFGDLCQGPHLSSTNQIDPAGFCLDRLAGAYWRGDEKKKMLTRIYGWAFASKQELEQFLLRRAEAEKRDHRKLGEELNLFSFHDAAPGFPFWHAKGVIIYNVIVNFWRQEHLNAGYQEIKTPLILDKNLWEQSGHWEHYREQMYFTKIDKRDFAVKPMNCPGAIQIFQNNLYSYRDLPLRWGELGLVHRHELSGVLYGLFRVRAFTQDDAHIFCLPEQIGDEVARIIDLADRIYHQFGFKDYRLELSTRPKKSIGDKKMWDLAEASLEKVLQKKGLKYRLNSGDGAFYGPKIDFHIKDALGRTWQCGTIQLDFAMPERFDLVYTTTSGAKARPVIIHRTILGSLERFIGILLEHYGGALPVWLASVQAIILPISEKFNEFSCGVYTKLRTNGVRVDVNMSNETLNKKIRSAELQKIPYIIVVGEKEKLSGQLAVRQRGEANVTQMTVADLTKEIMGSKI